MRRRIYAHRGLWQDPLEQNSLKALTDALERGFSVEFDVRELAGQACISHGPSSSNVPYLNALEVPDASEGKLAINIKADGLAEQVIQFAKGRNAFVFDASIPELLSYKKLGFPFAERRSEYEPVSALGAKVTWLDAFNDEWFLELGNDSPLWSKQEIVLVSPELHGRNQANAWKWLRSIWDHKPQVSVCTDHPLAFVDFLENS